MAENPSDPSEPLDVQTIHHLVRLMKRYDLTAIDILERRHDPDPSPAARAEVATAPAAVPHRPGSGHRRPPPPPTAGRPGPTGARPRPPGRTRRVVIESPMVGTYLRLERPGRPAVRLRRLRRPARHDRLHHRGHEGLHRHPRGRLGHDRRDPGQERPAGRVRSAPLPRDSELIRASWSRVLVSRRSRRPNGMSPGGLSNDFPTPLNVNPHLELSSEDSADVSTHPGGQPR